MPSRVDSHAFEIQRQSASSSFLDRRIFPGPSQSCTMQLAVAILAITSRCAGSPASHAEVCEMQFQREEPVPRNDLYGSRCRRRRRPPAAVPGPDPSPPMEMEARSFRSPNHGKNPGPWPKESWARAALGPSPPQSRRVALPRGPMGARWRSKRFDLHPFRSPSAARWAPGGRRRRAARWAPGLDGAGARRPALLERGRVGA
jgi:hypothetical protein